VSAVSIMMHQKALLDAIHCCSAVETSESAMLVKARSRLVKTTMSVNTRAIFIVGY
jgi:hypothetical protein